MFRAQKLTELGRGNPAALTSDRLTVADILKMLEDRYAVERRHSLQNLAMRTRFLKEWHGQTKVGHFTSDRILAYALKRRDMGAAVATVNVELTYLRRAFSVAMEAGRIAYHPKVSRLPGTNVRQGFIRDDQLQAMLAELPERYRTVVRFLRLTGWRLMEGLGLERRRVDFEAQEIRLETSKTGRPRTLPFGTYPALSDLLKDQEAYAESLQRVGALIVTHVFPNSRGGAINPTSLQKAWIRAREKLGFGDIMLHDLRRTLVREMEQKGIPRSVAMTITGHKSEVVYQRYAIVAQQDVEEGLKRLSGPTRQKVIGMAGRGQLKSTKKS